MTIPTEPIGSIPRPLQLIKAVAASGGGSDPKMNSLYEEAIKDTIERFEATGSPVITDGEQRKYHNFWTYSVHGFPTLRRMASKSLSPPVTSAACFGLRPGRFVTTCMLTNTWMSRCVTRIHP